MVRLTFGRRSERVTGPTLFDGVPDADPNLSAVDPPAAPDPPPGDAPAKRRGHGRRPRPGDLPRERVEIDLTDAEKVCPCCRTTRVRIGAEDRKSTRLNSSHLGISYAVSC